MSDGHPLDEQWARAEIDAFGRVQGVFYRDTIRRAALDSGVTGSATNMADGSVSIVLEGPREQVAAVIDVARHGPPAAQVERLEINWEEPVGVTGFAIGTEY